MLALMGLLLARRTSGWRRAFWSVSLVALATLGVDELFDLHESSGVGLVADHMKVVLWLGAAGALAVIHWLERPGRGARRRWLPLPALRTVKPAAASWCAPPCCAWMHITAICR